MRFLATSGVPAGLLQGALWCVLALVGACGSGASDPPAGARPVTLASPEHEAESASAREVAGGLGEALGEALGVLRAWDARRAAAWREQDVRALRALYVPGSTAGAADERLLRAYTDRGLVVRRMETQVFAARVLHRSPRSLRLLVHDRVAGGRVLARSGPRRLRSSAPVRRVLELRLASGRWRMVAVSESG